MQQERADDPQLDATLQSMETAYRMQTEHPTFSMSAKRAKPLLRCTGEGSTARGCLTAARLIERGVRMVQVYYAKGDPWDHHFDIELHRKTGKDSDQPFAALIKDLKFARTVGRDAHRVRLRVRQNAGGGVGSGFMGGQVHNGRDHNPHGFTVWLAGGGVKGGMTYGTTDDFGWKGVDKRVHVHDLHATILYLMGIDHTKLTYRYSGRDFR